MLKQHSSNGLGPRHALAADQFIDLVEKRRRQAHSDDGARRFASFHVRKLTTNRGHPVMSHDAALVVGMIMKLHQLA
jgi:hypothetical protein